MKWTIQKRADGTKEAVCSEHGQPHSIHPHACDGCCMKEGFPLEEIRPTRISPLPVQAIPLAVIRMDGWETPIHVLVHLEAGDALTTQQLRTQFPASDLDDALYWLKAEGLIQTTRNHQMQRVVRITTIGQLALRMSRARHGVYD
jgi:hypothetical protein